MSPGRVLALLLVLGVILFGLQQVLASDGSESRLAVETGSELVNEELNAVAPAPAKAAPCPYCGLDPNLWQKQTSVAPPPLSAAAVAVVEASCGRLIFGLNQDERLPPASLTKIVTALVIAEDRQLSEKVKATINGWELSAEDESSIMGLEEGMEVTVEELLYGLMLPSGNDAALELAKLDGGEKAFLDKMARRVEGLGLKNSKFTTPDGRDSPGQYTTALDIALLGRELIQNKTLRPIAGSKTFPWDGRLLWNTNYQLHVFPDVTGIKTGFTDAAKETIVASSMRDGREIVVGVLSTDWAYFDSRKLFDWAFTNTTSSC